MVPLFSVVRNKKCAIVLSLLERKFTVLPLRTYRTRGSESRSNERLKSDLVLTPCWTAPLNKYQHFVGSMDKLFSLREQRSSSERTTWISERALDGDSKQVQKNIQKLSEPLMAFVAFEAAFDSAPRDLLSHIQAFVGVP